MRFLTTCAATALVASTAFAQDRPNTILVMDGSGSMWGQIDGVAKITIAQDVVGDLLESIPADQGLGLTVYGHRERGNCTDIETVVAPAPGTADAIRAAVSGIKPLGKTPMTDAVIAAAEALRYTEDKATVILVSDGVETCNPDPCAAARLLEDAGIDFTAHVVGFDVGSDQDALDQMQCIAAETGGKFLTADTADQLVEALTEVAIAIPVQEPEPLFSTVTMTAVIEGTDMMVDGPVLWDINDGDGLVLDDVTGNPLTQDLPEGSYVANAYSVALETDLNKQFVVIGGKPAEVEIAFPAPVETARVIAPSEAPLGSTIEVGWDGPAEDGDYIGIGKVGATGADAWQNFTYVRDGNPVTLLMPPEEGPHLIQYFKADGREPLGSAEIMVTGVEISVAPPAEAEAGSTITVDWVGPNYKGDYIGIGQVGATGADGWEEYAYTETSNPASIKTPTTSGDYLVTYFIGQDRTVAAQVAMKVVDVAANIIAPAEAVAGSVIQVGWSGPDYQGDYIGIGKTDAKGSAPWENYQYTEAGNPVNLTIPTEPGDYLIQYFLGQDRSTLKTVPITVVAVGASLTAPQTAIAGDTITVEWTGPNYQGDYIGIGKVDATGSAPWEQYTYTEAGSPLDLRIPAEAGDYLIQYFVGQDRSVLTTTQITVSAPTATLAAPTALTAGDTISVDWTGPDYAGDYIGIGKVGATGSAPWEQYAYTENGNPASIRVPTEPGDYLITYFVGLDRSVLKSMPVTVAPVDVRLITATSAAAGSELAVGWDGPNYNGDYIGIGKVGATNSAAWQAYSYTDAGNPAMIMLPEQPGDYVVTYFIGLDRSVAAQVPLTIE